MAEIGQAVAGMDDRIDADVDDNDVMVEAWPLDHMAVQVHHFAERRSRWDDVRRLKARAEQATAAGRVMAAPGDVAQPALGLVGRTRQNAQATRGVGVAGDAACDFFGRSPLSRAQFDHECRQIQAIQPVIERASVVASRLALAGSDAHSADVGRVERGDEWQQELRRDAGFRRDLVDAIRAPRGEDVLGMHADRQVWAKRLHRLEQAMGHPAAYEPGRVAGKHRVEVRDVLGHNEIAVVEA
jgi:hypothetical protein